MEIWKKVKGYEGIYEVSNLGRVKSLSRIVLKKGKYPFLTKEKILKQSNNYRGYKHVGLYLNKKMKTLTVHQLVVIAFLNHKPNGQELVVNHINLIKKDNRLENLELVSNRENSNHKHIPSSSKYTGVSWHKNHLKWGAQIHINKKKVHLGYFVNEVDASNAYQEKLLSIQ